MKLKFNLLQRGTVAILQWTAILFAVLLQSSRGLYNGIALLPNCWILSFMKHNCSKIAFEIRIFFLPFGMQFYCSVFHKTVRIQQSSCTFIAVLLPTRIAIWSAIASTVPYCRLVVHGEQIRNYSFLLLAHVSTC